MPRISVVVPIYNVEPYLRECLESVAAQTFGDLEAILVDDGSTDGSAAIAQEFAARDERFRLITQPNGGLGKARNTGIDAAAGELLAFLDSDDVLPPDAYALLVGALDESGSDFATGNVYRLTRHGTIQAPFLAKTFRETRLKTHVTEFQPLLVDRIVPNKLWRRTFWDEHHLRFPEGMLHEDIPVVLPAQFLARSVDVVADPVYLYRIREGEDRSITQRRTEQRALLDRIKAVQLASAFLADEGPKEAKRWYDASVVAEDLRYYLNVLDQADEDYRGLFLDRVNELLETVDHTVFDELTAIERLKWHLVQRRLMPELLEVLRFQREELTHTPPVHEGGHWYGDYPYRDDPRLNIPKSIYRIEGELKHAARVDSVGWEDGKLHVGGWAFITRLGAEEPGAQEISIVALRPGRLARLRLMLTRRRFAVRQTRRPEVTAVPQHQVRDFSWSGFEATLDLTRLRTRGRWRESTFDLYITVRAGGVKRRRPTYWTQGWRPVVAVDHEVEPGVVLTVGPGELGGVSVRVREQRPEITGHRLADGALELTGTLPPGQEGKPLLALVLDDVAQLRFPMEVDGSRFTVRVRAADVAASVPEDELPLRWELHVAGGGPRRRLALPRDAGESALGAGDRAVVLVRTREGEAALGVRRPSPVVTAARWRDERTLELRGRITGDHAPELVARTPGRGDAHVFPLRVDREAGTFEAVLTPAAVATLAGELPLRDGTWQLRARPAADAGTPVPTSQEDDDPALTPLLAADALAPALPVTSVVDHKPFMFVRTADGRAVLVVEQDLDDDERGGYHQHRLRRDVYAPRRTEPLRDVVVYSSFGGRQCSDSPLAIHEELVRRGVALEHLWVVHDGACRVPGTATALREGSREHYEALATARYVVVNDHFPDWFARRPDQTCVQTWHGTPLKRLGFDASATQGTQRRFDRRWPEQVANWQYVLSPNRFSTDVLRSAYRIEGELLETGLPRNDALAGPRRDEVRARVRERLGLAPETRAILYAPTFRDGVIDRDNNYRLDLHLDAARLRGTLGPDAVVLFRKHHYIVDPVPVTADGFVRDVSAYPDGTELLAAADVLVTDYSSMMFDFANTGRPMLFFAYDLEDYARSIRGFYLDFEEIAPGPIVRTTDELAAALRDLDGVRAGYADRYAAFAQRFCELDDGGAAARVVDRVFGGAA